MTISQGFISTWNDSSKLPRSFKIQGQNHWCSTRCEFSKFSWTTKGSEELAKSAFLYGPRNGLASSNKMATVNNLATSCNIWLAILWNTADPRMPRSLEELPGAHLKWLGVLSPRHIAGMMTAKKQGDTTNTKVDKELNLTTIVQAKAYRNSW